MPKSISELKITKDTNTALIVGSGASIDMLPYEIICKTFIKNHYVIALNETWIIPNLEYDFIINHHTVKDLPAKYLEDYQKSIYEKPFKHVFSQYDCNNVNRGTTFYKGDYYFYEGYPVCESTNVYVEPLINYRDDHLFVGGTILLDAIGLAFRLGCKNIFMIGIDGGKINGHAYCSYYRNIWPEDEFFVTGHSYRTMKSLLAFTEWAKQRGWTFTNLSPNLGNAIPYLSPEEMNKNTAGFNFNVIENY